MDGRLRRRFRLGHLRYRLYPAWVWTRHLNARNFEVLVVKRKLLVRDWYCYELVHSGLMWWLLVSIPPGVVHPTSRGMHQKWTTPEVMAYTKNGPPHQPWRIPKVGQPISRGVHPKCSPKMFHTTGHQRLACKRYLWPVGILCIHLHWS